MSVILKIIKDTDSSEMILLSEIHWKCLLGIEISLWYMDYKFISKEVETVNSSEPMCLFNVDNLSTKGCTTDDYMSTQKFIIWYYRFW